MEAKSFNPDLFSRLAEARRLAQGECESFEASEAVTQIVNLAELQLPEVVRMALLNYSTEASVAWIACPTMRECLAARRVLARHTNMVCTFEYSEAGQVKFTFQL